MAFFRRAARTRAEVIAAADDARARGRIRKAVQGYDEALRGDPADASVNLRIAPLLAKLGDVERSAQCFRRAAAAHAEKGFTDRASGVCAAAVATFPLDAGFRLEAARLELVRGRRQDAVNGLVDGGRALARARRRDAAVSLLRRALEIEPQHLEAVLALAPALAASGARDEGLALLERLERTARGRALARVRWVKLRLAPSPGALWRWLRAALARGR